MDTNGLSSSLTAALERGLVSLVEHLVFWLPRVAIALVVLVVAIRVGRWLARTAARPFRATTPTLQQFIERAAALGFGALGAALALNILGLGAFAAGILASGSVVAIVLGFAFQEIGTNLFAGVFLAFNRPFEVGDIIECNGFQGVVQALDLRTTHIRNFDGRDIFIPNAVVFTNTLVNYTVDDLRRRAFVVGIRYEDDAGAAMRVLREAAASTPGVLAEPAAGAGIVALGGSTVELEVAYWVSMDDPIEIRAQIAANVMDRCRRALLDGGFTVSANVAAAVELSGGPSPRPVHVALGHAGGAT